MQTVSVVIPTTGRPTIAAALRSVEQQGHPVDVIVVFDTEQLPTELPESSAPVRYLCTGGGRGGSSARNMGVAAAIGDWVAFLDDDDEWLPGKLDQQLTAARSIVARGRQPVVGSRVLQRRASRDSISSPAPNHLIDVGQSPQDYLFHGRKVTLARPLFPTSTILTSLAVARMVPWQPDLRRHQDWQWLIEADRLEYTEVVQVEAPGALYTVGSAQSISASPDWRASLNWARSWREDWNRQTYVDFLAAQALRYALQARELEGVRRVLQEIHAAGRRPHFGSALSGLLGLVPRGAAERAAMRLAEISGSRTRRLM